MIGNTETSRLINGGPHAGTRAGAALAAQADYKEEKALKSCHTEFHHISFGVATIGRWS